MKKLFQAIRHDLPIFYRDASASPLGRFSVRMWIASGAVTLGASAVLILTPYASKLHDWAHLLHGGGVGAFIVYSFFMGREALSNQHARHMAELQKMTMDFDAHVAALNAIRIKTEGFSFPVRGDANKN